MKKKRTKAVAARFESLRPSPEAAAAGEQDWAYGCEVSTTREHTRGRYEQREVVVRRKTLRQRHTTENPAIETHYYLSSNRADAAELGRLISNH